mgnify:CR=1 FL=1
MPEVLVGIGEGGVYEVYEIDEGAVVGAALSIGDG